MEDYVTDIPIVSSLFHQNNSLVDSLEQKIVYCLPLSGRDGVICTSNKSIDKLGCKLSLPWLLEPLAEYS